MNLKIVISVLISSLVASTAGIFIENELKNVTKRENVSPAEWTEEGLWSTLLEEWTLNNK